jgi:hypothetical protein
MATRIKLRRDTSANWTTLNPILALGEPGVETDTRKMKIGDGSTHWKYLSYAITGDLQVDGTSIESAGAVTLSSGLGNRANWAITFDGIEGGSPLGFNTNAVAYDSMGNSVILGSIFSGQGTTLAKLDPQGNIMWNFTYQEYQNYGYSLSVDKNDDIVFAISETVTEGTDDDIILLKVSGDTGNIMWQKYITSYGDYDDYANALVTDSRGDIIMAGQASAHGAGNWYRLLVAKFSGATGTILWQKYYDDFTYGNNNNNDVAYGLAIDPSDNLLVTGQNSNPGNSYTPVMKLNGADGNITWELKIEDVAVHNGNTYGNGHITGIDATADSNGDFYVSLYIELDFPGSIGAIAKISAGGKILWCKSVGGLLFDGVAGSLVCDSLNNVYFTSSQEKYDNNNRYRQVIVKFNPTGGVVWQRELYREQQEDYSTYYSNTAQLLAVNDDYLLIGGATYLTYDYGNGNNGVHRGWAAQLDKAGTEFELGSWTFKAGKTPVPVVSASIYADTQFNDFDPATVITGDLSVTASEVTSMPNMATSVLAYIYEPRAKTLTLDGDTLKLPGATFDIARESVGQFTTIGNFDGTEGGNIKGNVWPNGVTRDENGVYVAGTWHSNETWNDDISNKNIPLLWKLDNQGKIAWQAGTNIDQTNISFSVDMAAVALNPVNKNPIVVNLDGHEGFYIYELDKDSGNINSHIKHVETAEHNLVPQALAVMSDGTPVVAGFLSGAYNTYTNVTGGGAGLTGSTNGYNLVIPKSVFHRTAPVETIYPTADGSWYIHRPSVLTTQIVSVNHYTTVASTVTNTLGSGAQFTITLNPTDGHGQNYSVDAVTAGGAGYKVGRVIQILGSSLGGVDGTDDVQIRVTAVDGSGAVTSAEPKYNVDTNGNFGTQTPGTNTAVTGTAVAPSGATFTVDINPVNNQYVGITVDGSEGMNYAIGDVLQINGADVGGITSTNNITLEVTNPYIARNYPGKIWRDSHNGTAGVTITTGTAQSTNIKLTVNGSYDFTQVMNNLEVYENLSADGFIWTPNWNFSIGKDQGSYDYFYNVAVDSNDDVVAGGYFQYTNLPLSDLRGYDQTSWVAKFNGTTGEQLWSVSIDGAEGTQSVNTIVTDTDNNIYVLSDGNAYKGPFLTKLNASGEQLWQHRVYTNNGSSSAANQGLAIDKNNNLILGGVYYADPLDNSQHYFNNGLYIGKFDQDGNLTWQRQISSIKDMQRGYDLTYYNTIAVHGDRYSIVAYSSNPGNQNTQALVADLPLDGTGLGNHGDWVYEAVEFNINSYQHSSHAFTATVSKLVFDVSTTTAITVFADKETEIAPVYKDMGGNITSVAEIVFEDGSKQRTSGQDIPQVKVSKTNGYDYFLKIEDRGHHIYSYYNDNTIYVPTNDQVPFPIGTAITIVSDDNTVYINAYDTGTTTLRHAGTSDYNQNFYLPYYGMATLLKIGPDLWVLSGTGITY